MPPVAAPALGGRAPPASRPPAAAAPPRPSGTPCSATSSSFSMARARPRKSGRGVPAREPPWLELVLADPGEEEEEPARESSGTRERPPRRRFCSASCRCDDLKAEEQRTRWGRRAALLSGRWRKRKVAAEEGGRDRDDCHHCFPSFAGACRCRSRADRHGSTTYAPSATRR
ncbi:unnamed protein product [Urochloa humidicola]